MSEIDDVRFSFILPTTCRPTLNRALKSVINQIGPQDEILLVTDFTLSNVALSPDLVGHQIRMLHHPRSGDWGNPERRMALPMAKGTHICILDDDDQYLPGALGVMRANCVAYPNRPLMFRMIDPDGRVLWVEKEIWCGNHGGPQLVTPNVPGRVGTWGLGEREADFAFLASTLSKYPDSVQALVWVDAVIYGCRGWVMAPHRAERE